MGQTDVPERLLYEDCRKGIRSDGAEGGIRGFRLPGRTMQGFDKER